MSKSCKYYDAFADVRPAEVVDTVQHGEPIATLIGWNAVRAAAKDWSIYSSDAPFRVPIPSEEDVRTVRQLPIEVDPPLHTDIRKQLEPWFRRPAEASYQADLQTLILREVSATKGAGSVDFVREFALPLQSRSLALLLNLPVSAADNWIGWGTHVFHDGEDGEAKGAAVDDYIRRELKRAGSAPGADFFTALTEMRLGARRLTEDEMAGIANLVFAGGRDTVIHAVTTLLVWYGEDRAAMHQAADTPRGANLAIEELLRVSAPLSQIGRVCPRGARIGDLDVPPDGRVALNWLGANFDPAIFRDAERIDLARSPNPHLAFGSGHHACLGALQARAILRTLLAGLVAENLHVSIQSACTQAEAMGQFQRDSAYLQVLGSIQ